MQTPDAANTANAANAANAANVANATEVPRIWHGRVLKNHDWGEKYSMLEDKDYTTHNGGLLGNAVTRGVFNMFGKCVVCEKNCYEYCVGTSDAPFTNKLTKPFGSFSNPIKMHGGTPQSAVMKQALEDQNVCVSWKAAFYFAAKYENTATESIPKEAIAVFHKHAANFNNMLASWKSLMATENVDEDLRQHYNEQLAKFDKLQRVLDRVCPGVTPTPSKARARSFRARDMAVNALRAAAAAAAAAAAPVAPVQPIAPNTQALLDAIERFEFWQIAPLRTKRKHDDSADKGAVSFLID